MSGSAPWAISGTYLEACNCEAICPCRTVGGRKGGRSTYGTCLGALSWRIEEGDAGDVALSGLNVVLALRYEDDEPGSPGTSSSTSTIGPTSLSETRSRRSSSDGWGDSCEQFPWAFKASNLLGVRAAPIEIEHTPGRGWFRAGGEVSVRIRGAVAEQEAGHVRDPRSSSARPRGGGGRAGRRRRAARLRGERQVRV